MSYRNRRNDRYSLLKLSFSSSAVRELKSGEKLRCAETLASLLITKNSILPSDQVGQFGSPEAFGSPDVAKLVQYTWSRFESAASSEVDGNHCHSLSRKLPNT